MIELKEHLKHDLANPPQPPKPADKSTDEEEARSPNTRLHQIIKKIFVPYKETIVILFKS